MYRILIVDDSAVDRKLTSSLLAQKTSWQIDQCDNAVDALTLIERVQPDLVISDLQMPEMDGLQLIGQISERFPIIPVIIITSQGSEELALDALRQGAASYCPKSRLSRDLVGIARNVLSISVKKRKTEEVLNRISGARISFELENDSTLIPPVVEHLQSHMLSWNETDRLRIGIALDESLTNAMHHGNLEVDSALRDEGDGTRYKEEIRKRSQMIPYRERRVRLNAEMSPKEVRFTILDQGPGFCPADVPDPTSPENLEKPSGRGLLLIRTFMNEVHHNSAGNEITLVKRREPMPS